MDYYFSEHEHIYRCNTCKRGWGALNAICDRSHCSGVCTRAIIDEKDIKGVRRTKNLVKIMEKLSSKLIRKMKDVLDAWLDLIVEEDE